MGTFIIKFAGVDFSILMHFPCCEFVLFYFTLLFTCTGKALSVCSGTLMDSFTMSCIQGCCTVSSSPECECFFWHRKIPTSCICACKFCFTVKQTNIQTTTKKTCFRVFCLFGWFLRYWDCCRCTGEESRKIKDLWIYICLSNSLVLDVMFISANPLLNARVLSTVCSTLYYSNQDVLEKKIICAGAHHQCRSMSSFTQIHSKAHVLPRTTARLSHSKAQAGSVCAGESWKVWMFFMLQETYLSTVTSTNP